MLKILSAVAVRRIFKPSTHFVNGTHNQKLKCQVLTEEWNKICARIEYSPQKFLRHLAQWTRVLSFQNYSLCKKELQCISVNILWMCKECMDNNKQHFQYLVIWLIFICNVLGNMFVNYASSTIIYVLITQRNTLPLPGQLNDLCEALQ
jgi:hypothetical protein